MHRQLCFASPSDFLTRHLYVYIDTQTNERAPDERFSEYWANELGGRTSWEVPNWTEIWAQRVKRSELTHDLGKWREYWDPKLLIKFYENTEARPSEFCQINPFTNANIPQ